MSEFDPTKLDYNQQVAMHKAMSEGVRFRNQGFEALEKGKYKKAIENFEQGLKLFEKGFGHDNISVVCFWIGLSETYMKLKDWDNAEIPAKKFLKMARKYEYEDEVMVAMELLSEIEIGRNGGKPVQDENENSNQNETDPLCGSCKSVVAKFRCSSCKSANYCSKECQKSDWISHKTKCYTTTLKAKNKSNEPKPRCGLCGFEGSRAINVVKTDCCGNWICQDVETYEFMSYKLNSCQRNHERYTMCGSHYKEDHDGKYQDCAKCKYASGFMRGRTPEESAWNRFCDKHFCFENVTDKERKRNRELKRDGTKAMLTSFKLG